MATVLIVDDSLIIRKKLKQDIKDLGHDVVGVASDGDSSIVLAGKLKPDIITMDVAMPNTDGIEALREIKQINPDIKIIMVTSHGQEEVILNSIAEGADGYLLKPIEKHKLGKVLNDVALKIK